MGFGAKMDAEAEKALNVKDGVKVDEVFMHDA